MPMVVGLGFKATDGGEPHKEEEVVLEGETEEHHCITKSDPLSDVSGRDPKVTLPK